MWREIGTIAFLFFVGVALASPEHQDEMRAIAFIESSSGTNFNHPVVKSGMHAGHQAAGKYGLMPLTIKDIILKNSHLKSHYQKLANLKPKDITKIINRNEKLDKYLAMFLWKKLRTEFGPRRSAYAWYHGPSKARVASLETIMNSEYVKKFSKEMENIKNETEIKRTRPVGISASR